MHVRQQIREAFAEAVAGLTTTGSNVFQSRTTDLERCELPCLLVYTGEEASDVASVGHPRRIDRQVKINIEAVAASKADLDDLLDQMAEEIETAIGASPTFGGLCKGAFISASTPGLSTVGNKPVGVNRLEYTVNYATLENNPGQPK